MLSFVPDCSCQLRFPFDKLTSTVRVRISLFHDGTRGFRGRHFPVGRVRVTLAIIERPARCRTIERERGRVETGLKAAGNELERPSWRIMVQKFRLAAPSETDAIITRRPGQEPWARRLNLQLYVA